MLNFTFTCKGNTVLYQVIERQSGDFEIGEKLCR